MSDFCECVSRSGAFCNKCTGIRRMEPSIETLRAENEALKADRQALNDANDLIRETFIQKDAQIKVLAEALEVYADPENHMSHWTDEAFYVPDAIYETHSKATSPIGTLAKQALSTIPAEALKEWKLSEVLNKASVEYHDAFHSKTQHSLNLTQEAKTAYIYAFRKAVNDFEANRKGVKDGQVYTAYFEAHREKRK